MSYLKFFPSHKTLAMVLALVCCASYELPAQAKSKVVNEKVSSSISLLTNGNILISQSKSFPSIEVQADPTPPNTGDTNREAGASGRSICPIGSESNSLITALVPIIQETDGQNESGTTSETVLGLTVDEHPTFWFYVPYWLTSECYAEFVLEDESGTEVYKTTLTDSQDSHGVVGIKLPATEPKLKMGQWYQWKLSFYLGVADTINVNGWVQRVEMEEKTSQKGVSFYEQTGIWHDPLTKLANSRLQDPEDEELKTEWEKLLKAVNLEAIAQEPILDFGD